MTVNGRVLTKAGAPVPPAADVAINAETPKFVCRCARDFSFCGAHLLCRAACARAESFSECKEERPQRVCLCKGVLAQQCGT